MIGSACAVSGYQALFPPHLKKGPGYEANGPAAVAGAMNKVVAFLQGELEVQGRV